VYVRVRSWGCGNLTEVTQYSQAAAFLPVKYSFIKAIQAGNFSTWTTLTAQHVKQYLETLESNNKGHMNQQRKNVRSTLRKENATAQDEEDNMSETHTKHKTNLIYAVVHNIEGHTYTYLTGRFPAVSSRGYKYILILYDFDMNNIMAEPMKNRSDAESIREYTVIYDELTSKGLKPLSQTMENEASTALKTFFMALQMKFQLILTHIHRQNAAERAIQMFKNHFIAGICTTDKQFPLHLWD
jgi:hypothetical protein